MPRRIRSILFALLVTISALSLSPLRTPAWSQERSPGERMVLIRDAETETLLRGFAVSLYRAAGLDPRKIRIILVRDRAINAFVSTGNRMFIHTGLLLQTDSALEVVGTMAHETGHVLHADISRAPEMARQALLQTLGSLLIAGAAGIAAHDAGVGAGAMMGGVSMAHRTYLSFSRGQEESADESAMHFLDRLGWSARGLLRLFERLEQEDAMISDRRDPYALTHPMTHDRMAFVQRHIATAPAGAGDLPPKIETDYRMVRAKLDGFLSIPGTVLRAYAANDPSPAARYARAAAEHQLSHRTAALALMDGLIGEQPGNPWFRELKGQILYENGQARPAVASYQEAVRLAPDQPLLRQGLAQAMLETSDRVLLRQAVDHLEFAQRQDREDDTTWHLLGIAWGRLGNLGEANLALAEEAMLANDIPAARRFARMAVDSLAQGPSKLRAIDIGNAVKKENRQ
jgi:predicted Zn-dependent protease